jgi:hypothetical protein
MTKATSWAMFCSLLLSMAACGGESPSPNPDFSRDTVTDSQADGPTDAPTDAPTDVQRDAPADTAAPDGDATHGMDT